MLYQYSSNENYLTTASDNFRQNLFIHIQQLGKIYFIIKNFKLFFKYTVFRRLTKYLESIFSFNYIKYTCFLRRMRIVLPHLFNMTHMSVWMNVLLYELLLRSQCFNVLSAPSRDVLMSFLKYVEMLCLQNYFATCLNKIQETISQM